MQKRTAASIVANKLFVNRAHEPANPLYDNIEIRDISGLAGVVGL
ncbi:hypothetical protein OKW50_006962 [Paraburkholderia youngii]|uniref:Uncharacterized protein n=1 Tax=Paraburkholderia youngii TaxID=2782701 RepID=A0A7W8LDS9_9BURK|nr:hypothetical protein [Paraburkholderia youngii]MBB5404823.1 hypothetical protein [Paraburkholderia youngii]